MPQLQMNSCQGCTFCSTLGEACLFCCISFPAAVILFRASSALRAVSQPPPSFPFRSAPPVSTPLSPMLRARRRLLACASVPGHGALMHVPAAACAAQSARPFWRGLHAAASAMRHAEAAQTNQSQLARADPRLPYAAPPTGAASSVAAVSPSALATELPRPGTVALSAAPVPFRPHRPLPPRIQSLIDAQLIKLRRKEHPEWLEKQHVRKMTLHERKQLVSRWTQMMTTAPPQTAPQTPARTLDSHNNHAGSGGGSLHCSMCNFCCSPSSFSLWCHSVLLRDCCS